MGCSDSKPDDGEGEEGENAPTVQLIEAVQAVTEADPKKSKKLLDEYVLGELLGEGAFGVVYKCRKKGTNQDFAVKMVDQVEMSIIEIEREVFTLQTLEHPSILKLCDVFYEKVFVCMVLQLYKGGDMVRGMMVHWKKKGNIPTEAIRQVAQQMWEAVTYVHEKSYVHRDIKGDNFLMDYPDIAHRENRFYLSDFGTVIEIKDDTRLSEKCGTKNYWAPEFYRQDYGIKVDCWAVGVLLFGFFSGKFPFKNEDEVFNKELKYSSRIDPAGKAMLQWALNREEFERCDASEALRHEFITRGIEPDRGTSMISGVEEDAIGDDIKECGANAGIAERRRELVDRLVKNAVQAGGGRSAANMGALWSQYRGCSVHFKQLDDNAFCVTDKIIQRTRTFKWVPMADEQAARHQQTAQSKEKISTHQLNEELNKDDIHQLLENHRVPLENFGKNKAKQLSEFIQEIQEGKARLLIDATQPKCLVRGVDTVLVRIYVRTKKGRKYLVETKEKYPDGRSRENYWQLPGFKKAPYENVMQAVERVVRERLKMEDCHTMFNFSNCELREQRVESVSYPGVQTVYLKETVTGMLTVSDRKILKRIGIFGDTNKFEVEDSAHYVRTYQWMDEEVCILKGVPTKISKNNQDDISTLIWPPVGLEEDALMKLLTANNFDLSAWGPGTVSQLSNELVKGESKLVKSEEGQFVRSVDIVVALITKSADGMNSLLCEVEQDSGGQVKALDRLPARKRRLDEHPFTAARRLFQRDLNLDENTVSIHPGDVRIELVEEESPSYPGLRTQYRKHYISATMRFLPGDVNMPAGQSRSNNSAAGANYSARSAW